MTSKADTIKSLHKIREDISDKMDATKEQLTGLKETIEELQSEYNVLIENWHAVNRLLAVYGELPTTVKEEKKLQGSIQDETELPPKPLRPADAIMWLFRNIKNEWNPIDIRDRFEQFRKGDKLNSNANNLLWVIHSSLKSLVRRGDLKKIETDKDPYYRLVEKEKGLL